MNSTEQITCSKSQENIFHGCKIKDIRLNEGNFMEFFMRQFLNKAERFQANIGQLKSEREKIHLVSIIWCIQKVNDWDVNEKHEIGSDIIQA